jgi:hypothetical protein
LSPLRTRYSLLSDPALAKAANQTGDFESAFVAFDQVRRNRLRPAVQALLDLANAELAERHARWWARLSPRWPDKAPIGRKRARTGSLDVAPAPRGRRRSRPRAGQSSGCVGGLR